MDFQISGRFQVTFFKKNLVESSLKKHQLSKRQLLAVEFINEHGSISNTEYQNIAKISQRTATREFNELKLKNVLISTGRSQGSGRGLVYRLQEVK